MKPTFKRTRVWVDPAFQGRLLIRMAFYLLLYTLVILHVGFFFQAMRNLAANGPAANFASQYVDYLGQQFPLFLAVLLLGPWLLYNLLLFSHRIAGPLFRCRRVLREMAAGQVVPEFKPRQGDLMLELFEALNELIRKCNDRARPEPPGSDGDVKQAVRSEQVTAGGQG